MQYELVPHRAVTRRDFLTGLTLTAGGTLVPQALGQSLSTALAGSHRYSIAGADIEFWLTPVSESTLRISILARDSGLEPTAAFPGVGEATATTSASCGMICRAAA